MGGIYGKAMPQTTAEWSEDLMQLYADHGGRLAAIAWRILRRHDLAEEAVQDAFIHFHQRGCKPQPGKELAYLKVMVANNAKTTVRRQERFMLRDDFEQEPFSGNVSDEPSPVDVCVARSEASAIRAALQNLSPRQSDVMKLRYLHQMSEQEIAAHLQISQGSVKTYASRARDILRCELSDCA